MGRISSLFLSLLVLLAPLAAFPADSPQTVHTFSVQDGQFLLDGKPFQIISGEMHYPRIPREDWRARLRMARAMGLNAITTYVFWNEHESSPGVYDFSGNNDVAEFIREAQQEGLYVILRPGPYICAEWDLGGLPSWLLKDRSMVLRSTDPQFLAPTDKWLKRVGQELAPLQVGNGGPILLVQVENEYGSFGSDHAYMEQIHHMLLDAGFTKSQLYTADGPEQIANGSLPELPVGINFGGSQASAAQKAFAVLKQTRPHGPFFASEFWDGWFDHWGEKHAVTDQTQEAANLHWMLRQGYSVSLYMFEGGTSFGWMNGANSEKNNYQPDVTSYDYDAPLDESGRPTTKWYRFRNLITADTRKVPPLVPDVAPAIQVPEFQLPETVSLWDALPAPVHSEQPLPMEDLNQAYGDILYRRQLDGPVKGELVLHDLHDYAQVYLDGRPSAIMDRRLGQDRIDLDVQAPHARLDILVENTGRVNFGPAIQGERKGITQEITLDGKPLTGWDIYALPMLDPAKLAYGHAPCQGTCFFRGTFHIEQPGDTFLDTSAFSKGEVWLNGRPLGRIWNIGPQKTLYVPGPWLHKGENEVVVFSLLGPAHATLAGRERPILNDLGKQQPSSSF